LSTDYRGDPIGLSIFLLDAEVVYNKDNLRGKLPIFLQNTQPPAVVQGSYFSGYEKGTLAQNKEVAERFIACLLTK
jgi:hypothetical protein